MAAQAAILTEPRIVRVGDGTLAPGGTPCQVAVGTKEWLQLVMGTEQIREMIAVKQAWPVALRDLAESDAGWLHVFWITTRGHPRWAASIREGTARQEPRMRSAPGALRISSWRASGAHAAHALFEGLFGMTVSFIARLGSLAQVMEMTPLMGCRGQDLLHGLTDRALTSTDDSHHGNAPGLCDPFQECRQGGGDADNKLWANNTLPERQSRMLYRTSWPTSGCNPSRAKRTRPWEVVSRRRQAEA